MELRSGDIYKKVKKMNDIKQTHPRRSSAVLVILAIAAVSSLYLSGMLPLTETLFDFAGNYGAEYIVRRQRSLLKSSNTMILRTDHENGANTEDYDSAAADAFGNSNSKAPASSSMNLQPYTLEDALYESSIFESTFTIIIYDPPTDRFIGLHNKDNAWADNSEKNYGEVWLPSYTRCAGSSQRDSIRPCQKWC